MKKVILIVIALSMSLHFLHAQDRQDSKWVVTAGPVVAFPLKFLHMFHSFGLGADFAAIHPISGGFSAGARANYSYFFGKESSNTTGGTISSHYDATHIFNLLGDVNYRLENGLTIGLDLGLGLSLTHVYGDASFARIIYVADEVGKKNPVIFGLYFDETNFQKNIGLRAGFRI
ncbi:MAG TPA: hypothetical protein VGI82_07315 [Chitinophagaceae bacterium]